MTEVVVIGAGAAGLAVARALAPLYHVTVVEASWSLGGLAARMSCKSADDCGLCASCTVPDLAREAEAEHGSRLLLGTVVEGAEELPQGGWRLRLSGREGGTVEADAIVVATGLDVADGAALTEYGAGHLAGVHTALDLDRALRALGDAHAPDAAAASMLPPDGASIAIIQCACSRDVRRLPYCSRVCCAYTARLALEVRHRLPATTVTVLYMDLQRADRVAERRIEEAMAAEGVRYVRARPACVQSIPGGRLAVVLEDPSTGAPTSLEFDRVVLSTGLVPSEGTRTMASMLGLAQDAGGFIARGPTGKAGTTSRPRAFVAGGSTGPVDIVEAVTGGLAAAGSVVRELGHAWEGSPPRILVVGEGGAAAEAAATARSAGAEVTQAGPGVRLMGLEGEVLGFRARLQGAGTGTRLVEADAVIVAPRAWRPPREHVPLSEPYEELDGLLEEGRRAFVMVMDHGAEALLAARSVLTTAPGASVRILHRDLSVSEPGMQELQLELAAKGVIFHRYAAGTLVVSPSPDGRGGRVTFVEETLPEQGTMEVMADAVLAAGARAPAEVSAPGIAKHAPLGVPTPERVGPLPCLTSRRGVYTTAVPTLSHVAAELGGQAAAAVAVAELVRGFPELDGVAAVDDEACAACLNCLRLCPHDAIVFDPSVRAARVMRRACQACGMCRGVCPAQAITLGDAVEGAAAGAAGGGSGG